MTKPANEKPASRKPLITPYRVMWSTLGSLAVVYLGVALFAPAWLGDLTPSAAERQRDDTQPQISQLRSEISGVRASVARLDLDSQSARNDAAAQASATKTLEDRVSALEQKSQAASMPPVADAAPAGHPTAPAPAATEPKTQPDVAAADAQPAPKVINSDAATAPPITTGSIDGDPVTPPAAKKQNNGAISFGPAVVKPAAKPVGIQIASDISVDGLRQRWAELSTAHADQLKKLGPRYETSVDGTNLTFNLVAGPVKSKADAKKICKELQAHDVLCKVSEFKGDAL